MFQTPPKTTVAGERSSSLRPAVARAAFLSLQSPNGNNVHPKESYLTLLITEGLQNLLHTLAGA